LPEKGNAFLRPLKNKDFEKKRVTIMRLDDLGKSTTLESNKSLMRLDDLGKSTTLESNKSLRPYAAKPIGGSGCQGGDPEGGAERALTQERAEITVRGLARTENRSGQMQARGAAPERRPPARPPRPWEAFHNPGAAAQQPGE
jgi:hypothetical protein